jgi:hypothetical protein
LACRVPDLKLDGLALELQGADLEVDTDGGHVGYTVVNPESGLSLLSGLEDRFDIAATPRECLILSLANRRTIRISIICESMTLTGISILASLVRWYPCCIAQASIQAGQLTGGAGTTFQYQSRR